jgi:DNA-binding LytR/AlgR family response regulator
MIRLAICDDEPHIRSIVRNDMQRVMASLGKLCQITEYADGSELVAACEKGAIFDIVILDIDMPGLDGRQTALSLRAINRDFVLIFLTNYEEYAREGYLVNAHRYLLKKLLTLELPEAIETAMTLLENKPRMISFSSSRHGLQQLYLKDILCAETIGRKILVHTKTDVFELKERMKFQDFAANFDGESFYPCYRGILINLESVHNLNNSQIVLINGKSIPVSRHQTKEIIQALVKRGVGKV